jgi:hypothetical protein
MLDWLQQLQFKLCLPVQPGETAELMERLEDCQMTLGPMATNRYRCHLVLCGMEGFHHVLILQQFRFRFRCYC